MSLKNLSSRIENIEQHVMVMNREMGEVMQSVKDVKERMSLQEKIFISFDVGIIALIVISIYASIL